MQPLSNQKSNLHRTPGYSSKRVASPFLRFSAWATQLRRNVTATASLDDNVSDLVGSGIKRKTSRADSEVLNPYANAGIQFYRFNYFFFFRLIVCKSTINFPEQYFQLCFILCLFQNLLQLTALRSLFLKLVSCKDITNNKVSCSSNISRYSIWEVLAGKVVCLILVFNFPRLA